ncbi:hypothetical protein BDZ45DRAFT_800458 [Acephala macrosclerotiorum]|nr:hypothetical protein BDZ45DRAFT_800458 [Acephala macrosclerotiorum]
MEFLFNPLISKAERQITLRAGILHALHTHTVYVDPRSTLLNSQQHELITPSLNDVSECLDDVTSLRGVTLPDVTRGEAAVERHDASTGSVQRDRTESVSDASQYVTGGCAVRYPSLSDTSIGSTVSSPSLDDESGNHTSISPSPQGSTNFESMNGSMSSRLSSLTQPPRILDIVPSIQSVVPDSPPSTVDTSRHTDMLTFAQFLAVHGISISPKIFGAI